MSFLPLDLQSVNHVAPSIRGHLSHKITGWHGMFFRERGINYLNFPLQARSVKPQMAAMSLARHHTMVTPSVAVTKQAPDFKGTAVVDGQFKEIKLSDYTGKYLVLFFYPLDL